MLWEGATEGGAIARALRRQAKGSTGQVGPEGGAQDRGKDPGLSLRLYCFTHSLLHHSGHTIYSSAEWATDTKWP